MRKVTKNDNTHTLEIIMFYENSKSLVYKVFGVFIYCTLEKYVFIDYLCLQKEKKLFLLYRVFEDTFHMMSFHELAFLIFLNFVSCYGFSQ